MAVPGDLSFCGVYLLAAHPADDLFLDGCWRLLVRIELHRVRRATLGARTQVGSVAEHLREGHVSTDDLAVAPLLHAADLAAAGREVTDDVTHVVLGSDDLDRHDRLEQDGMGPASGLLEHHRAGDLER